MALPRETDTHESYTDQLIYFIARLAANPHTAALVEPAEALLAQLDDGDAALTEARRAEIRARARRDYSDELSDTQIRKFKRRIDVVGDRELSSRLFPRGVTHTVAPRGRPQLERLDKLLVAMTEVGASPRVAAHADADEIKKVLDEGKATLGDYRAKLEVAITGWEAESLAVARASDAFNFARSEGVGQLGAVLGELRAKLGGDARAAYGYTQQGRSGGGEVVDEIDAPSEES